MSINGALQIGRTGMVAAQAGIQVAGNNMANAATEGYTRQIMHLSPARGEQVGRGQFVGGGVRIDDIRRAVDTALQQRLRSALSNEHGAHIAQRFLTAIETIHNELTSNDLSTLLSDFFNGFSELANNPNDGSVRSVLIEQGVALTDRIRHMRADLRAVRDEVDRDLGSTVRQANDILDRLAQVNTQIAQAEHGVGTANSLRDQRDQLVNELSKLIDITTIEQPNGAVDVLVGSVPIVLAGQSRGIELRLESKDGDLTATVRVRDDGSHLPVRSGRIGALLEQRDGPVQQSLDSLDTFALQLIQQVNTLHSQGQGTIAFTDVAGTYRVEDTSANLNAAAANLPFAIENGSFFIHVTHQQTGTRTTHQIQVDGNGMSLEDLVDQINNTVAVPNITAGINASNGFTLTAASGYEFSFSDDTAGSLAALGVNTYFTGRDATDIAINDRVRSNPSLIAAGGGHIDGSNETALAIANLQDASLDDLGGRSLRQYWNDHVNTIGVKARSASDATQSTRIVRESIGAQVAAVSGVSLDEEAINLLTFQRQFQASARYITVIDEMMQVLLGMVR